MKTEGIGSWNNVKKNVSTTIKIFKTIVLRDIKIMRYYISIILFAFIFSCKKERNLIMPNKPQNNSQVKSATCDCDVAERMQQQLI